MPVRVLWVIKGLGPGGAETLLANAAEVHDRATFSIECAYVLPYKDHLAERLEVAGVRAVCVSRTHRDLWWPMRLARLVRAGGFDVVHVHSPLPGTVARVTALSMRRRRPRLVTTEHNGWRTFAVLTRLANRWSSRWDDATFAVSDEVRESMHGPAQRRAVTLVHGIDVDAVACLAPQRDLVRAEFGFTVDDLVIGTVANFREQKDYPTLLRAARNFLDRGGRARWLVVGQGPLEQQTRILATQFGLDDHVTFTGFRADATRVQAAFDIFTLSSRWEGLPVALMEALAIGTPVAATSVGGVAESLVNGKSAVLVSPGDPHALASAWEHIAGEADLRQQLGAASRALAPQFDARRAQATIEATYARLCPGMATSRPEAPPAYAPRRSSGLDIRPLEDADEPAVLQLLGRSLGWNDDPRFRDLYRWKHVDNAFGPSFGWVATDTGRVVAVRLFMRWNFVRGGETLHAVRAVDTATDPDYQGRGLFTALTMHGLDELRAEGIDFVFNTPNAQSRPGYLKMGWREVGHVRAAVRPVRVASLPRLARSRVPADHWSMSIAVGMSIQNWLERNCYTSGRSDNDQRTIRTDTSEAYLRWRYGLGHLNYRVIGCSDGAVVMRARLRGPAIEVVEETFWGLSLSEVDRVCLSTARSVHADHVLRGGQSSSAGFLSVPGLGPMLTCRAVSLAAVPPMSNWALEMGDVELM